ncbi:MAG: Rrf2 family transcriptional regulator [Proteobacteria bacterium]|nr:Rrf2 family transcriptional regulator [Pseudomonadota bacterium]
MKLQKNTVLALYSVLEFAARPDEHIPAGEIAEKYGESVHHLAKVLSELVRARIVASVRGVGGGYRFIGNARRLTLLNVIVLFEDLAQELPEPPPQAGATHEALVRVLGEIDRIALATLGSVTIATLLKDIGRAGGAAGKAAG